MPGQLSYDREEQEKSQRTKNQNKQYSALAPITAQLAAASFVLARKSINSIFQIGLIPLKPFTHSVSFEKADPLFDKNLIIQNHHLTLKSQLKVIEKQ